MLVCQVIENFLQKERRAEFTYKHLTSKNMREKKNIFFVVILADVDTALLSFKKSTMSHFWSLVVTQKG